MSLVNCCFSEEESDLSDISAVFAGLVLYYIQLLATTTNDVIAEFTYEFGSGLLGMYTQSYVCSMYKVSRIVFGRVACKQPDC